MRHIHPSPVQLVKEVGKTTDPVPHKVDNRSNWKNIQAARSDSKATRPGHKLLRFFSS